MEKPVNDYRRFYAALKRTPGYGDEEERKAGLVSTYTQGRTTHLHEMTSREYTEMCRAMENAQDYVVRRKRQRSIVLHVMQRMGIDTSDWMRINDFCRNSRICGKDFGQLDIDELMALQKKLRAIERSGGLKAEKEQKTDSEPPVKANITFINNNNNQNYGTDRQHYRQRTGDC